MSFTHQGSPVRHTSQCHFNQSTRGTPPSRTAVQSSTHADLLAFESSISQPITVSQLTADPNVVLVSDSAASLSPFPFDHFAYLELHDIVSSQLPHCASLRSALKNTHQACGPTSSGNPSSWDAISRRSHNPPSPPSQVGSAPSAQPDKRQPSTPFPSIPVKYVQNSSSAFRSPLAGLLSQIQSQAQTTRVTTPTASPVQKAANYLASDGLLVRAVEDGTEEVEDTVYKVPELFRSVLRERRTVRTVSGPNIFSGVRQQWGETDGSGGTPDVVVAAGAGAVGGLIPSVLTSWVEAKKRRSWSAA